MADRQEPTISQTGVWVDTATGHVVESEPEQGKLLVAPGGEIDQRVRDDIAAAKLVSSQPDEPVEDAEDKDEDDTVVEPVEEPRARRGGRQRGTEADAPEKATE